MKIRSGRKKIIWEINVTPLTDVALVLLIIFMISAPAMLQSGIKVKLPASVSSEKESERKAVVTVTVDGKIFWGKDEIRKENLLGLLTSFLAGSTNKVIMIDADKLTPHGTVVSVMDLARRAGADKLYVTTTRETR